METVGKLVTALVALVLIGTGLYYAISYNFREFEGAPLTASAIIASTSTPVVIIATSTPVEIVAINPDLFDQAGTIVYYVQQGVEVPYLFYTKGGRTQSKALEFTNESICVTSVESPCPGAIDTFKDDYGSGPVDVQGTPDNESLIVTRIAAAPV